MSLQPPDTRGCIFRANFDGECYICAASPTVVVEGHITPQTLLCGTHFFNDRLMIDWELWNEPTEGTD